MTTTAPTATQPVTIDALLGDDSSTLESESKSSSSTFAWTPEQEAIFAHFAQPPSILPHLVVRARAGCGKTTVILQSVSHATWAKSILLCAFNKRIAEELKLKCKDPRTEIKTLHAIGFSFLRSLGKLQVDENREIKIARDLCGRQRDELVIPSAKLATKIKEINHLATLQDAIDLAWRFDCLPDTDSRYTVEDVSHMALDICLKSQQNDGTISFADMLYLPLALNLTRANWDLVVVDEAQDMSPTQIILAQRCVKSTGRIVVVGDDRQGIYAFRGADSQTIDNLKSTLSADELTLTVTHRCPKSVVSLSQRLVPDYIAAESAPDGIVDTVKYIDLAKSVTPGSFVLSRKNAPLMTVCLSLLRQNIRARIQGKDIGAQLRSIVAKLKASSVSDFLSRLYTWQEKEIKRAQSRGNGIGSGREDVVRDIYETLCALSEDVTGMDELYGKIESLFSETYDVERSDYVVCSSVHKAKGLEASRVFLLAETLYPGNRHDVMEEQNIEYVAITRAKHHLSMVVEMERRS